MDTTRLFRLYALCDSAVFMENADHRRNLLDQFKAFVLLLQEDMVALHKYRQLVEKIVSLCVQDATGDSSVDYNEAFRRICSLRVGGTTTAAVAEGKQEWNNYVRLIKWALEGFHIFTNFEGHATNSGQGFPDIHRKDPLVWGESVLNGVLSNWKALAFMCMDSLVVSLAWIHATLKEDTSASDVITPSPTPRSESPPSSRPPAPVNVKSPPPPLPPPPASGNGNAMAVAEEFPALPYKRIVDRPITANSQQTPTSPLYYPTLNADDKRALKALLTELRRRKDADKAPRKFALCDRGGKCWNSSCDFAHNDSELNVIALAKLCQQGGLWKRVNCTNHDCKFGTGCNFLHPDDDVQRIERIMSSFDKLQSVGALHVLSTDGKQMVRIEFDQEKYEFALHMQKKK